MTGKLNIIDILKAEPYLQKNSPTDEDIDVFTQDEDLSRHTRINVVGRLQFAESAITKATREAENAITRNNVGELRSHVSNAIEYLEGARVGLEEIERLVTKEIKPEFAQAVHDPVRARAGRGRGPMHALTPPRVQRKEEDEVEPDKTIEEHTQELNDIVQEFRKMAVSQPEKVTLSTYNRFVSLLTDRDESAKEYLTPKQYVDFGKQYSGALEHLRSAFDKYIVRREHAGEEPEKESRGKLF